MGLATTPYFMAMVMAILLTATLRGIFIAKDRVRHLLFLALNLAATLAFGVLIGTFGFVDTAVGGGYGTFSMNLNALFNPLSIGVPAWSAVLKPRGQILGNYDGFNYLGAGALCFLLAIVLAGLYRLPGNWRQALKGLPRYADLLLLCLACTLYAVTNVVTFENRIVL